MGMLVLEGMNGEIDWQAQQTSQLVFSVIAHGGGDINNHWTKKLFIFMPLIKLLNDECSPLTGSGGVLVL